MNNLKKNSFAAEAYTLLLPAEIFPHSLFLQPYPDDSASQTDDKPASAALGILLVSHPVQNTD